MIYEVQGYRSDKTISPEYKVNYLARMLAGYDDQTWARLRADRKRTYERAASMLLADQHNILAQIQEWSDFDRRIADDLEKSRRESEPRLRTEIERIKAEIQKEK